MKQRELTGRTVLICLIGFFAVVAAANAALVYAATSTFSGVEVESSYAAGLKFEHELEAVRAQDALHWNVSATLDRASDGATALAVSVRDAAGAPVSAIAIEARLEHPADGRADHVITLQPAGPGLFKGTTDAGPAQYDLLIGVSRDGRTVFRSKSRVGLK
jgi:nitrogen fixation protein FixH